jgi:putative ABC transport system permease protein
MMFKIAFRSIFRNRRRSLMTMSTIMIGTVATLIFGGFVNYIFLGLETGAVQSGGHLTVFRKGYFLYGSGNPGAYGIDEYQQVLALIKEDPVLKDKVAVVTPTQAIAGIAGNFDNDTSKPFFGVGFVPSDRDKMLTWNGYNLVGNTPLPTGLLDADPSQGLIGEGLGRILGLCEPLHIANCPKPPQAKETAQGPIDKSLLELSGRDRPAAGAKLEAPQPHIDLLAATSGGAPNVVSLIVTSARVQGVKELNDSYVGMNLKLAQQLLYGRGTPKASGIVVQLKSTKDMGAMHKRLVALFDEHHLDLEVLDFKQLSPFYSQVVGLFASIFIFISTIIGIVVLFTVTNTIGMSVMERIDEIGTTRALGLRRAGIRWQFLMEGSVLGILGATAGVILAIVLSILVNHAGLTWTPPGQVRPIPLTIYMFGSLALPVATWIILVLVSTVSAYMPARRAAKMPVVDALRHV